MPHCNRAAKIQLSRDVYHMTPYSASQTLARRVTENPAHNGSIQWREAIRSNRGKLLGPAEVYQSRQGIRNSGSGLHQATGSLRLTTTLLYPKRLPPLVAAKLDCRVHAEEFCLQFDC